METRPSAPYSSAIRLLRVEAGLSAEAGRTDTKFSSLKNRSVLGHRYYDTNGNLVRRHFHEVDTGTFSNPIIHAAVSYSVRLATRHELSIPGDITSGTQYLTGNGRVYSRDGENNRGGGRQNH
jgi:hypothetical protein